MSANHSLGQSARQLQRLDNVSARTARRPFLFSLLPTSLNLQCCSYLAFHHCYDLCDSFSCEFTLLLQIFGSPIASGKSFAFSPRLPTYHLVPARTFFPFWLYTRLLTFILTSFYFALSRH